MKKIQNDVSNEIQIYQFYFRLINQNDDEIQKKIGLALLTISFKPSKVNLKKQTKRIEHFLWILETLVKFSGKAPPAGSKDVKAEAIYNNEKLGSVISLVESSDEPDEDFEKIEHALEKKAPTSKQSTKSTNIFDYLLKNLANSKS